MTANHTMLQQVVSELHMTSQPEYLQVSELSIEPSTEIIFLQVLNSDSQGFEIALHSDGTFEAVPVGG